MLCYILVFCALLCWCICLCCVLDSVCELFVKQFKQFAMCLGVVAILFLNVMYVFSVGGGALLNRPCMVFQGMCVLYLWSQCASKCFFHRFCLSEVISSFKSLRDGSQAFAILMLFLCVILHTIWSGKSPQLLCILPFGMLCLSAISMMFVKIMLAVCMVV